MQSAGLLCDGVLLHKVLSSASSALEHESAANLLAHQRDLQRLQQELDVLNKTSMELSTANTAYERQLSQVNSHITRLTTELTAAEARLEAETYRNKLPTQALQQELAETKASLVAAKVENARKLAELASTCKIKVDKEHRKRLDLETKVEKLEQEFAPFRAAAKKFALTSYGLLRPRWQHRRWECVTPLLTAWQRLAGMEQ